jgi:hypothetical protein
VRPRTANATSVAKWVIDGEGKAKGKDRAVRHLADNEVDHHDDDGGISLGCLVCAPVESQLNARGKQDVKTWRGYECVEALVDSGAGERMCGPQLGPPA